MFSYARFTVAKTASTLSVVVPYKSNLDRMLMVVLIHFGHQNSGAITGAKTGAL